MNEVIKDRRYWGYYVFTALIVATMLLVEDILEKETDYTAMIIDYLTDIPLFTLVIFVISLVSYPIVVYLNHRFPWEQALIKRFFLEVTIIITMVIFLIFSTSWVVREVFLFSDPDDDFGYEILALIMFFIAIFMIFSFHEFMILSNRKEYLEFRATMLEKQNDLVKYEALKNQVNPHFLFNSLNVLSSLIYKDTTKSDQFIKKFSDVFRYVLELNQEKMVPLKRELKFLDSYYFLQKIRYGDNLNIHKTLDADVLEHMIPPLSLQLVVENALKHNVIADDQKLEITIENRKDRLVVANNYQYKADLNGSTGIGQKNLIEKYHLISEQSPEFYVEGDRYVASLPLMNKLEWIES